MKRRLAKERNRRISLFPLFGMGTLCWNPFAKSPFIRFQSMHLSLRETLTHCGPRRACRATQRRDTCRDPPSRGERREKKSRSMCRLHTDTSRTLTLSRPVQSGHLHLLYLGHSVHVWEEVPGKRRAKVERDAEDAQDRRLQHEPGRRRACVCEKRRLKKYPPEKTRVLASFATLCDCP